MISLCSLGEQLKLCDNFPVPRAQTFFMITLISIDAGLLEYTGLLVHVTATSLLLAGVWEL